MPMHSLDPTEDFAIRLLRRFLLLCEHPRTRQRMLRLVRQSTQVGPDAPKLYGWINRAVLNPRFQPVVERRALSAMKAELVASQLIGLAMTRYVLRLEPIASASVDEVVRLAAPSLSAALQGEDAFSPAAVRPEGPTSAGPTRRRLPGLRAPRLPGARAVRRTAARVRARA
ncbi:hypothetical protein FHP29_11775 [Nocardioides albidus]|uniref:Tetracyclin repressor-like C-terminal domain-containing protein n=1 Tax=Nocardioides albidus TaxID=1517589 RepID=A0A5C4VW04_9ACTN|nr:hypothetical protein [Nocardioides albidus]TNM39555.1 hypothetical protein FHP29_11775 [Nocardioides albidus]